MTFVQILVKILALAIAQCLAIASTTPSLDFLHQTFSSHSISYGHPSVAQLAEVECTVRINYTSCSETDVFSFATRDSLTPDGTLKGGPSLPWTKQMFFLFRVNAL